MNTMATYSLPSLYEVVKPEQYYHTTFQNNNNSSTTTGSNSNSSSSSSSAFHRVGSPPELLHDSEEDDGDSFSSTSTTPQHDLLFDEHTYHSRRKSVPHKSPSILQDVFQASAIDKSVIFQWDTTTLLPPIQQQHDNNDTSSATIIKPKVICGESLLSALRHRVALARQQDLPIKKRIIHMPRRQLTATCIELPNHHQQGITKHKLSIPIIHQHTSSSSSSSHHHSMKINNNISINSLIDPLPKPSSSFNQIDPISNSSPSSPIAPIVKQRGRKPLQPSSTSTTTTRHTSSGRPSRVKGPCQACQETSDGCMRKAFDWPFPTNQTFNDKGKPFVYLCNKCGLRFNKSGGCVCRHCRWVFCKEEKRKAMQYIEQMRRNRPDGYIDPEEEIENFVCTPKYWSCGQRWKVGWVLNSTTSTSATHSSDDDEDIDTISSSSPSYPTSPSL